MLWMQSISPGAAELLQRVARTCSLDFQLKGAGATRLVIRHAEEVLPATEQFSEEELDNLQGAVIVCPVESEAQKAEAFALRQRVFIDELKRQRESETDDTDNRSVHLIATVDKVVIGTCRMHASPINDGTAVIGRVVVDPGYRGAGIGSLLMEYAANLAATRGYSSCAVNAALDVDGFYRKLGYRPEGGIFDIAGADHIRMRLLLEPVTTS